MESKYKQIKPLSDWKCIVKFGCLKKWHNRVQINEIKYIKWLDEKYEK